MRIHAQILSAATLLLAACASYDASSVPDPAGGEGATESSLISDIESMSRRSDGRFDVVCRGGRTEIVTAADIAAERVCNEVAVGGIRIFSGNTCRGAALANVDASTSCGTLSDTTTAGSILRDGVCTDIADASVRATCAVVQPGRVFIYGSSDSCGGSVVASVSASTDCMTLSNTQSAWSVMQNGVCSNINDTNVRAACFELQPGNRTLIYGSSDSCSGAVLASVTETTNCEALSNTQSSWSVSKNGVCTNITDTDVRSACLAQQPGRTLIYGNNDACGGSVVASVSESTDCMTLSNTQSAWSILKNGVCTNINDTNARDACLQHQPGTRTLLYGSSDSCSGAVLASVTETTNCEALSNTQSSWSVSKNGVCTNINDTDVRSACLAQQPGRTLIYGNNDACGGAVVASISESTDCMTLSNTQSVWSILKNGVCTNINDTNARDACLEHQPGTRTLIYGNSDSCSGTVLASVTPTTDCQALSNTQSSWSVKKNGVCNNISDTDVRSACLAHQ